MKTRKRQQNKTYKFKDFTYDDLCELWIKFHNENGRYPNTTDMQRNYNIPNLHTVKKILEDRFDEFDETYMKNIRWRKNTNKESLRLFLRGTLNATWKKDSINNCHGKCVISGESYDDVHHLYSFNKIIEETLQELGLDHRKYRESYTIEEITLIKELFIKKNYDYGLGVCLTRRYHNEFHSIFGSDATKDDFKKYKKYKDNNWDISRLRKTVYTNNTPCSKDYIVIYRSEVEEILKMKSENTKITLFVFLITSKLYNSQAEFYMSYPKLSDILANTISENTLIKCVNELVSNNLLYKYPIEEVKKEYREMGLKYHFSPVNKYKLLIRKEKDDNENIKIKIENKDIVNIYYLILLYFYSDKEIRNKLSRRQYDKVIPLRNKVKLNDCIIINN